jgi:TatD DNase family protein
MALKHAGNPKPMTRIPMPSWIDFHTHILDSPSLETAAAESRAAHVSRWLVNSVDLDNYAAHLLLSKNHPEALVGLGWHPEQVIEVSPEKISSTLKKFSTRVKSAPYLGETGLDFLYGKTDAHKALQKKVFSQFIEWSREHDKLIQVHTRHAKQESLDLLADLGAEKVILHWFNGNTKQQSLIVQKKWVCTVGPTILNSPHVDKFIAAQPLELLGLETDSPIPFDGKPSSPAYIERVASRVAEIKGVSLRDVEHAQHGIFSRFFPHLSLNSRAEK